MNCLYFSVLTLANNCECFSCLYFILTPLLARMINSFGRLFLVTKFHYEIISSDVEMCIRQSLQISEPGNMNMQTNSKGMDRSNFHILQTLM